MQNATKLSLVSAAGLACWLASELPALANAASPESGSEALALTPGARPPSQPIDPSQGATATQPSLEPAAVETVELADMLASESAPAIAKPAKSTAELEDAADFADFDPPEALEELEELETLGELARNSEAAPPAAEAGLVGPTVAELAPTEAVPLSNFATESRDLEELATLDDLEDFDNADHLAQGPAVNTLTDVQPGDWAFSALQDLNARYNCLQGYPDGTFRGDRPLSRYEFAAGLNACYQQLEILISDNAAQFASSGDLEVLQRLLQEFAAELDAIAGQVGSLEERINFLEERQFSTTATLSGEAISTLWSGLGEAPIIDFRAIEGGIEPFFSSRDLDAGTALGTRLRLRTDVSFSGRDRLRVQMQVLNATALSTVTNSPMTELTTSPDPFETADLSLELDSLDYRFPLGDRLRLLVSASGRLTDIAAPLNPYFHDEAEGALSQFGQYNPIYRYGAGAGAGLEYRLSDRVDLSFGYLAGGKSTVRPSTEPSLFNGTYGLVSQLHWRLTDNFRAAVSYVHSYNFDPGVGSNRANPRTTLANFGRFINTEGLATAIAQLLSSLDLPDLQALLNSLGLDPALLAALSNLTPAEVFNTPVGEALARAGIVANPDEFAGQTLGSLFPNANLPAETAGQTVSQALNAAGFSGSPSSLTLGSLFQLQLTGVPGVNQAANPFLTPTVGSQVSGVPGTVAGQTGAEALNSTGFDGTLGSIRLLNVLQASEIETPESLDTVRTVLGTLTLGDLVERLGSINQPFGSLTAEDVLNALITPDLIEDTLAQLPNTIPVVSNSYGLELFWEVSPRFALNGWVGYTHTRTLENLTLPGFGTLERGEIRILNAALGFAFPDLWQEGNLGGLIVGVEPFAISGLLGSDGYPGLHLEAFYRHRLTEAIALTPGFIWLTAPDNNPIVGDVLIGIVRASLIF